MYLSAVLNLTLKKPVSKNYLNQYWYYLNLQCYFFKNKFRLLFEEIR